MQLFPALAVLMAASALGGSAIAADREELSGLGFEIGLNWHFPRQRPLEEGQGQFLAFDWDLGAARVGYRFENVDMRSKADDNNNGIAVEANYQNSIHEIILHKQVYEDAVRVGLGLGMAKIHGTIAVNGDGGPTGVMFDRLAPTGDCFVAISPLTGGKRVHAALNVIIGYRILWMKGADPDQAGVNYQSDMTEMSGSHLGLSLNVLF